MKVGKKNLYLILWVSSILFLWPNYLKSQKNDRYTLVETVGPAPGTINIPYKKYKFSNGLTLLVHEDHSDPVVYVDVTYHVGSGREIYGRSGFAHFFEHMMFQGSDHVGDEEHFRIITEAGGTLNGTTNTDRTNYFETIPSNQLEVALWLESDRMGWFLDAVTSEKFEVQRATVKNERGQNYDNAPYGLVGEKLREGLYPFNHPYSWSTIGYIDDLNAATLDDLKRFFLRWYGPNNAILTVAGDVQADQVAALVDKYFSDIPSGPPVSAPTSQPVTFEKDRFISYEDNVKMPLIKLVWPTVEQTHPDALALDAVAFALGHGKSSPLYQKLVKTQLAQSASSNHPTFELTGHLEATVYALPGQSLEKIRNTVLECLKELATKGISEDVLRRFKSITETQVLHGLRTVQGKGSRLAYYATFFPTPDYLPRFLKALQELTVLQVNAAMKKYILEKPCLTVSCVPKGQTALLPAPDNVSRPSPPPGFKPDLKEYNNLTYHKPKSSIDRSKKPTPGPAPVVNTPDFTVKTSSKEVSFVVTPYNELPVTDILVNILGGYAKDVASKAGVTPLMASLMRESTENYTAESLSDQLELLGCSLEVSGERDEVSVALSCPNRNLDKGINLLKEVLFYPKFKEDEFKRARDRQLQSLRNQGVNARSIAHNVLCKKSYVPTLAASLPDLGTEETLASLTVEDVKMRHRMLLMHPDLVTVAVVGAIKAEEVPGKLGFLWNWETPFPIPEKPKIPEPDFEASRPGNVPPPGSEQPKEELPPEIKERITQIRRLFAPPKSPPILFNPQEKTTIFFAHKENAAQSQILVAMKGIMYHPLAESFLCRIINFPLGGGFNSRLNQNLREKRGYTYGIRSSFSVSRYNDVWTCAAAVKKEATDTALLEILREIKEYAEKGMTPEEHEFTKKALLLSDALKYESPGQKASYLKMISEFGFVKDIPQRQKELLERVTLLQLNEKARMHFSDKPFTIVVVGDGPTVLPKLLKLGYPVVEVDAFGNDLRATSKN